MSEKNSLMKSIKKDISNAKSGGGFNNFFSLKGTGAKCRVRFLQDFEEGLEVTFHDKFKVCQHPCLTYYGLDCPNCGNSDVRTSNNYIWQIYNYETKKVELFMFKANKSSPINALINIYEEFDSITDKDLIIIRNGEGTDTTYNVLPGREAPFKKETKKFTKKQIFDLLKKVYNTVGVDETIEDYDDGSSDDEEEKPKKKKAKKKVIEEEDDDDEFDEDEEEKPKKKAKSSKKKEKKYAAFNDDEDDVDIDDLDDDELPFDEEEEDDDEEELPPPKKKKKKR